MTLVTSIVSSALRKIRVIDANAAPEAQEMADAIDAMNRMLMRWQADGTQLGFSPVSMPSDVMPIPIEAENAVIYALALEMGSEYGVAPTQDVVGLARGYMAALLRDQLVSTPLRSGRTGAPWPDATWGSGYNVYTDGYR